jgi:WD40 repeat protein
MTPSARIIKAAFSADGKQFYIVSADGKARIWNADSTAKPRVWDLTADDIAERRADIAADATLLVTGGIFPLGPAGILAIWDIASGKCKQKLDIPPVTSVAIGAQGNVLVAGDYECGIATIDLKTGRFVKGSRDDASVRLVAISHNERLVAANLMPGFRRKDIEGR